MWYKALMVLGVAVFLANCASAQEAHPKRMLGLLKVGDYVEARSKDGSATSLVVYPTQDDWSMVYDSKRISTDELRAKYPAAEKQVLAYIENVKQYSGGKDSFSNPNTKIVTYGADGFSVFSKIIHVGEDYILTESKTGDRTAYSANEIGRILWTPARLQFMYVPSGQPSPKPQ